MSHRLPVIIQSIVYRKKGEDVEVLLLKRTEERGGFWNTVNGTLEIDESAVECRAREIREETGIQDIVSWSDQIHKFSFKYGEDTFVVVVFAAEVSEHQEVTLNDEHTEFQWTNPDEAMHILKFDDDKKALQNFLDTVIYGSETRDIE